MACIIELIWLCKHMKKVRSSQPAILVPNWIKHSFSLRVSLKQIWCYWITVYSSHLYKNMDLGLSCLFFLLNLICSIFSLFISIILSTNLFTELDIDRFRIYYRTSKCFIKSLTSAATWCNARKCYSLAHGNWYI